MYLAEQGLRGIVLDAVDLNEVLQDVVVIV